MPAFAGKPKTRFGVLPHRISHSPACLPSHHLSLPAQTVGFAGGKRPAELQVAPEARVIGVAAHRLSRPHEPSPFVSYTYFSPIFLLCL